MNASRLADLNPSPEVGCDSEDEADTQSLLLVLKELLDRLSSFREGGPASASGMSNDGRAESISIWKRGCQVPFRPRLT